MIDLQEFNSSLTQLARSRGFSVRTITTIEDYDILALHREANNPPQPNPLRLYLSAGLHGDEPAGPLAILAMLKQDRLPETFDITLCPLLNPTGIARGSRESKSGIDLNRDFRLLSSPETAAIVEFLNPLPAFDLTACLHEDWESTGFYFYAADAPSSLSQKILSRVAAIAPIDEASEIDGHPSVKGLIEVPAHASLADREDWPEAFYLQSKARHPHFTFESPSAFPIEERIEMQLTAVQTLIESFSA